MDRGIMVYVCSACYHNLLKAGLDRIDTVDPYRCENRSAYCIFCVICPGLVRALTTGREREGREKKGTSEGDLTEPGSKEHLRT
jgi:hypothetical protein